MFAGKFIAPLFIILSINIRGEVVVSQEGVGGTISTPFRDSGGRPQCIEIVGKIWERTAQLWDSVC